MSVDQEAVARAIASDLSDYVSGAADQEFYIAVGRAKKRLKELVPQPVWYLIRVVTLAELYRKASKDNEEAIGAEDIMDLLMSTMDDIEKDE